MLHWHRSFTPADRDHSVYHYVPFTVPEGVAGIEISYSFDRNGGSIIDLGLVDPDIRAFPSRTGFRGWSGSARSTVSVGTVQATPGYIAGPLQPGIWHVLLGLARIAPGGCACEVEVTLHYGDTAAETDPPRRVRPRYPTARRWYPGDLQSHTHYSDARGSLDDLIRAARDRNLEYLAVTDHNTHGHHRALKEAEQQDLLLVTGEEVTTYRGHANVWGVDGWTDFRISGEEDLEQLVSDVHARGGLFSVNHPKATADCLGCDWEYHVPDRADAFEAWQGPWPYRNSESLERYDAELRRGRRLTLVGGSDRHQPGYPDPDPPALQVGSPTTWLYLAGLAETEVLEAIRTGAAFVSESPEGPLLELAAGGVNMGGTVTRQAGAPVRAEARVTGAAGDQLHWVTDRGTERITPIGSADFQDGFDCPAGITYVRLEVVAGRSRPALLQQLRQLRPEFAAEAADVPWRRALSNPVYISAAEET